MDVILFVREAFERLASLRSVMLPQLLQSIPHIKSNKVVGWRQATNVFVETAAHSFVQVLRAAFWILGEYCNSVGDVEAAVKVIKCAAAFLFALLRMTHGCTFSGAALAHCRLWTLRSVRLPAQQRPRPSRRSPRW